MKKLIKVLALPVMSVIVLGGCSQNFDENKEIKIYTRDTSSGTRDGFFTGIGFEEAVKDAKKGDFIYFDPPYDSDTTTFNSYTEDGFNKDSQRRLAEVFKDLDNRGVYVMLSNHNTILVSELYKDYNFHFIEAKRNINANGKKRGKVEEVIITNYETK